MSQKKFFGLTFALMGLGLLITALIVGLVSANAMLLSFIYSMWLLIIIVQFMLAVAVAGFSQRANAGGLILVYMLFCVVNGLIIAPTVLYFSPDVVIAALGAAVITFMVTAIAGALTRIDLTKFSGIALVGLLGIIVVSFFNFFLYWINPGVANTVSWVITYAGVGIFVLLNAINMQQLKQLSLRLVGASSQDATKIAVLGALNLYLNFINIFLRFLRIAGRRG